VLERAVLAAGDDAQRQASVNQTKSQNLLILTYEVVGRVWANKMGAKSWHLVWKALLPEVRENNRHGGQTGASA
jgi:hypothetical protein